MGLKMGVFFKMQGYAGFDLRRGLEKGNCPVAGRHFLPGFQRCDLTNV